jgi:hypothetical protein
MSSKTVSPVTPSPIANSLGSVVTSAEASEVLAALASLFVLRASTVRNQENGTKERFPERQKRARVLFAKSTYLGNLPSDKCQAVVDGQAVKIGKSVISRDAEKHGPAKCILCSGTHGQEPKGTTITRADLMSMQTYYLTAKDEIIGISDTCRVRYLDADASSLLTNPGIYRADFPKQVTRDSMHKL